MPTRTTISQETARAFLAGEIAAEALPEPEWGPIGREVYDRTYSREVVDPDTGELIRKETWADTVKRVVQGNMGFAPDGVAQDDEAAELFCEIYRHAMIPAGRHLWVTGTDNNFNRNCWASGWEERTAEHFRFLAARLFEGGGVGANYSADLIAATTPVRNTVATYITCHADHVDLASVRSAAGTNWVEPNSPLEDVATTRYVVDDSREGWVAAWVYLIDLATAAIPEHRSVVFDLSEVRPHGAVLRTFGGKASGPAPLAEAIRTIADVTNSAVGRHLNGIEAMEIDHAIASSVVAGGTRRSARLALMHWRDPMVFEFMRCKADTSKHWTANISVEIDADFHAALAAGSSHAEAVLHAVAEGMAANGEPGLIDASAHSTAEPEPIRNVNPCLTGDTLVAVADGRGAVSIAELAASGDDVPVYTFDPSSRRPVIRLMRHPRVTGYATDILEVAFDNGQSVKVTPNHKFVDQHGRSVAADELVGGESLRSLSRSYVDGDAFVSCMSDAAYNEHFLLRRPVANLLTPAGAGARSAWMFDDAQVESVVERCCEECGRAFTTPFEFREVSLCSPECSAAQRERLDTDRRGSDFTSAQPNTVGVVGVRPAGIADVYNGTVDDFHTFFVSGTGGTAGSDFVLNLQCGEVSLQPFESCNIGSVNLEAYGTDFDGAMRAFELMARFLYRATLRSYPDSKAAAIEQRNRRIGVGLMGLQGWCAAHGAKLTDLCHHDGLLDMLSEFRKTCRRSANGLADDLSLPHPVKVTAIAPTGTIAQMPGTTPGIHPVFARYFNRRVRYADTDVALVELAAQGFHIEDDKMASNTKVVSFPIRDAILDRYDEELIEQSDEIAFGPFMELVQAVQDSYLAPGDGNAISATAQIPQGMEPEKLSKAMRELIGTLKGVTAFPEVSRPQAPYSSLTREEYEAELAAVSERSEGGVAVEALVGDSNDGSCDTGACPIR